VKKVDGNATTHLQHRIT